jgi:integrase
VRIGGRDHYLGRYGSPESWSKYERLVASYLATKLDATSAALPSISSRSAPEILIEELILRYWQHRKSEHPTTGRLAPQLYSVRAALKPLRALYAGLPAAKFGPKALRDCRERMIAAGQARSYVNGNVDKIRQMFRWAVSEELIPESVYSALSCLTALRAGRSTAREPAPIGPVPHEHVEVILRYVTPQVAAMIQIQLLTGARPGEIVRLRGCELDLSEEVWRYYPTEHKGAHLGRPRMLAIGPQAQELLRPWLKTDPLAYLFSPQEAVEACNAKRRKRLRARGRGKRLAGAPVESTHRPRRHYDVNTYRRAIQRACKRAGIPVWSPNQLRHAQGTLIRKRFGLEAAQAVLGHSDPKITTRYAEADQEKAIEIMRQIG